MSGRLYYVDWLRVIAFAILVVYHCSVAFFPDMSWLMKSAQGSETLSLVMKFPRAWRLALLFFVSGMGTWFAFRSNAGLAFLKDRTIRLLVPLLFAMCVIIVPQVWFERVYEDGYDGSLMSFWLTRYFTEGKYPQGNFTWAHMWFVAYLLVMAFLCYPIFRLIIDPRMRRLTGWFETVARSNAIYLLFLLPLVLNIALSPIFPRQTNSLYNDGAWFAVWASWFGLGFLVARHHHAVIEAIVERRWLSASFALALTVMLYRHSWAADPDDAFIGDYDNMTVLYKTALFGLAWSMILTAVGFGALHLNRKSNGLAWLNRKIFPLYIVHQTIIIAALFYILPLDAVVAAKMSLVLLATIGGSLVLCLLFEQLPWPFRALVGLPERPAGAPAPEKSTVPLRY
ncbi:acyltransferase family protein [Mesorhizobium sp. WSM2239]|uniref:Acyltransferase family protein n=2 Tax=unclassified Mesorhizobium TaxID=325217 RepID=A0AAU8D9C4_9HYPH